MNISVLGLGDASFPLCIQVARRGTDELGLDLDEAKTVRLPAGDSRIDHILSGGIAELTPAGSSPNPSPPSRSAKLDTTWVPMIVATRNAMAGTSDGEGEVWKA